MAIKPRRATDIGSTGGSEEKTHLELFSQGGKVGGQAVGLYKGCREGWGGEIDALFELLEWADNFGLWRKGRRLRGGGRYMDNGGDKRK